ncbi:glia maturation factor beta [Rhizopogon salebrosus TDB-379]|nr:glia maturation factor beta [Rhizopogon salebrosus TDB-379]
MATATRIVDIDEDVTKALRKFRFQRRSQGHAAIVIKINKVTLKMVVDDEYDDISIEDLVEELPRNSPRYVVLSYELKHRDGRISFPLVLVNWAPSSSETTMMTLHASALLDFQRVVSMTSSSSLNSTLHCMALTILQAEANKTIEVRDTDEGLTKQLVDDKLLS